LQAGEVELAATLLGRSYGVAGRVAHGAERGRLLGFPTANVVPPSNVGLPADGVYLVRASLPAWSGYGVANLGGRPTFAEEERLLEVHLLDFGGDIYGADLRVEFLGRLRATSRFESLDALKAQIGLDVTEARRLVRDVHGQR
jgi:riboflavin kinase/FMN adenylyltransferase